MDWEIKRDQFMNEYVPRVQADRIVQELEEKVRELTPLVSSAGWDVTWFLVGSAAFAILFSMTMFVVRQQEPEIIERFGRFHRVAMPGLRFKIPLIERRVWEADLRIQKLDVEVETKTKDNVFVFVRAAIQYAVMPGKVYESYYMLADDEEQIEAYVFDVIRSRVPKLELDEAFEQKDDIALAVNRELTESMESFGYVIKGVLVTDIEPDETVKKEMNEINAALRSKMAAQEKGEADKIIAVKLAEARKESDRLAGEGVASQRRAIVDGLRESIEEFSKAIPGVTPSSVMNIVLLTQYFDTLKQMGEHGKVIFANHSPGAVQSISEQLQQAIEATKS